jgi:4-hydroxyphenylpyruvate dioxygenase
MTTSRSRAFDDLTVDYVEFYVGDIEQSIGWLVDGYGFTVLATSPSGSDGPVRSVAVGQGDITVLFTEPLASDHPAKAYVDRHGDGVANIGLRVPDAVATFTAAVLAGARPATPPSERDGIVTAAVRGFGDVTHTFVQRPEGIAAYEPAGLVAVPDAVAGPGTGLREVDHFAVVVETGTLDEMVEYYQRTMNFDMTLSERIVTGDQAMFIKVVQSPSRKFTLTLVEADATLENGQIDEFLGDHGGPGVQHMAFSTDDILTSVKQIGDRGITLLSTPDTYYDALVERVRPDRHSVEDLHELSILLDQDHDGQLYQIFAKSVHPRNTIFLEIIERAGASSFGSRNIRSLYEAVEMQRNRQGRTEAPMQSLTIAERFAEQVARVPDAIAVTAGDTSLTYRELDARANQLAHRLIGLGVGQDDRVAVLLERSIDLVVGILATIKAGGAYVPVHEGYPQDRRQWVIDHAAPVALLADTAMSAGGLPEGVPTIIVDDDPETAGLPTDDPRVPIHPDQLAYVIHTSGSTGHPKGVAVTQRDVVRLIFDPQWTPEHHERVLMIAPYAFNVSTYDLWMPLLHGGRVVLAPPGRLELDTLGRLIRDEEITGIHLTAGLFRLVAQESPELLTGIREVLTGGDVIAPSAVRRALDTVPDLLVRAMYGVTESSLFAAHHPIRADYRPGKVVPVGEALTDTSIHILDERLAPVTDGVEGEVYISGRGVARGYFGEPVQTAERFVADPFGAPGARMYRTGDIARINDDGLIEYSGRAGSQVKIQGFRIELAEIESALAGQAGVAHVVVLVREQESGEKRLVAYVVPGPDGLDVGALGAHAREALPDYMVPSAFVEMESLPLTLNGKLDRDQMPEPDFDSASSFREPTTPRQKALCAIFASVLEVEQVGVDDSFFDLGGQSLQAMRLLSRVRDELDLDLPIHVLFDVPTVAGLDEHFESGQAAA